MVWWIWGSFSVCENTLNFFYSLHFILPWSLALLVAIYLFFLHFNGGSSIMFCHMDYDNIHFFLEFESSMVSEILFSLLFSFVLSGLMIFVESNSIYNPTHVVSEWYFLYAFTILRSVPNNFLGLILIFGHVFFLVIFIFPNINVMVLDSILFFFGCCFV